MEKPIYLGDGLYCEDDGIQFRLFTIREFGNVHEVFLDPYVLRAFLSFVGRQRNLEILPGDDNLIRDCS